MCGRFATTTDPALLAAKIKAIDETLGAGVEVPNYNVAPTHTVAAVVSRRSAPDDHPTRRVRLMRWGLVPSWVKAGPDGAPVTNGPLLINARADKVAGSPAFRGSAKSKRCLVPMDGYYEWRVNPGGAPSRKTPAKTPFYIFRREGEPLFAAGLWSVWKSTSAADPLLSCTIITTDAVGKLAAIHDRMPLMLTENDWEAWLDPDGPLDPELLVRPPEVDGLELRQVSTLVNSVRNNGPELLQPAQPEPQQITLL